MSNNKVILKLENNKQYVFFKPIFLGGIFLLLLISVITLAVNGFDKSKKIYLHCPSDSITDCENPFYDCSKDTLGYMEVCDISNIRQVEREGVIIPDTLKSMKYLPKGFIYGKPVPFIVKNFPLISGVVILFCFIINHYFCNKNFKFGVEEGWLEK